MTQYVCQCPQRAYFHFYRYIMRALVTGKQCQCPQRAYSHFYFSKKERKIMMINSVNALNGLIPISTVASRNP